MHEHLPTPLAVARNIVGETIIGAELAEPRTALVTPKAAS
jgi:hypothetical protein